MNVYGPIFAKKFAKGQGQWLYKTIGPTIQKFYESTPVGSKNRNLLDLACGAGVLIQYFAEKGYHVTGLDFSAHMIEMAKQNNKSFIKKGLVELQCQDITHFAVPATIGLAVAIGQIPNHLSDFNAFKECSTDVFHSLVTGGYYIADILVDTVPEKPLKKNKYSFLKNLSPQKNVGWTSLNITDTESEFCIDMSIHDPVAKKNIIHSTGFVRSKDNYEKYQETLYLTYYKIPEITEMLKSIGFRNIYFAQLEDLAISKSVEKIRGFRFMVAQK